MDIPQHHLKALRPAPISFDAARAEAQGQRIADTPDARGLCAVPNHGESIDASTSPEQPQVLGSPKASNRTNVQGNQELVETVTTGGAQTESAE